jgi:hypothetical protein
MTITLEKLKAAIQKKEEEYQRGILTVAKGAMAKFIKPFCRKRRVIFSSGMGTYSFTRLNGSPVDWEHYGDYNPKTERCDLWGPNDRAPEGYQEVYDAIHIDVPPNGELFEWMTDYDPQDDDPPKLTKAMTSLMRSLHDSHKQGVPTKRVYGRELPSARALVRRNLVTMEPLQGLDGKIIFGGHLVRLTRQGREYQCESR